MSATRKIRVSINGATSDYRIAPGTTPSSLAVNRQFLEDFSLGNNITVLVNGAESSREIPEAAVVSVRVNAARKAAPRTRVRVNANGSSEDYFLPTGVSTAAQLAASAEFRENFSLPTSITVLVNGTESSARLATGDVITTRVNASAKAW